MTQNLDRGPHSPQEYMDILRRRKWQIIIPCLVVFVTVAAVAFLLPAVFSSTSTILIESQQVPQDLIRTTVTGYAEERINAITQRILSRRVLLKIINDFDLYPDKRGNVPVEKILDDMRDDIAIEMVSAEVPDRRGGRPVTVNVAFTVSFEGPNPRVVMQVANRLTSLFLEHNLRMREDLAKTTTEILEQQIEKYRGVTRDLEERIARFKEDHMKELPNMIQLNLETERQMQRQIESVEQQIRTLEDRKIYFGGQLATVLPNFPISDAGGKYILDPRERLRALKSQAISLEATLSSKHPDVIKTRKEIAGLQKEVSIAEEKTQIENKLLQKELELKELKHGMTDKHPDIIKLKEEIQELKTTLNEYKDREKAGLTLEEAKPTNPAYINLQTQIKASEIDIIGLKNKKLELEAKWHDYVVRLEKMPEVEREYRELTRDYDAAQQKYSETMAKLMEARQGQNLEQSQAGEKFTIINPPQLPEAPIKPKRLAIILIGFILGIGTGIGWAAVIEAADMTVRTQKDVRRITGQPVLAAIPDVQEVKKMRGKGKGNE